MLFQKTFLPIAQRLVAEEINSLKGMLCLSFPSNQQNVSAVKGGKRCRKSSVRLILSSHQHTNIAFACLPQNYCK